MKHITLITYLLLLFILTACSQKIDHFPKNPDYAIHKPKVIYTPSIKNLGKMVKQLQGTPYVWAEEGPNQFDCSGFTYYLYGSMGIEIPRVARNQAKFGKHISVNNLKYGDLIFFATNKNNQRKITHVGLYLGKGWFTHASTAKKEVVYSNLFTSSYYKKRLRICRRYLPLKEELNPITNNEKKWQIKPIVNVIQKKSNKAILIQSPIKEFEDISNKEHFYIQVGSFTGYPKKKLLNKIKGYKFKYKIIQFKKENLTISKLLIGPYNTKEKAIIQLKKVRNNIVDSSFIAVIR